jgi:hypothetical protein
VGLFRLSSPNSKNALVQHGAFQIQLDVFVRFIDPSDAENHRAVHGFCNGWLMLLGIPPDYRNDLDIANAISTFGKYHHLNNEDPLKSRVLVYASFPSIASVLRDVVIGKFSSVGGVRESWTAVVYILTADFADALPADVDQMPLDGNPHPLPGQLQNNLDLNMFVMPPFLEIGWNELPPNLAEDLNQHANNLGQQNDVEQQFLDQVEDQHSMVLNPSDQPSSSSSSEGNNAAGDQVNLDLNLALGPLMGHSQAQNGALHVGFALTLIGPILPPEM